VRLVLSYHEDTDCCCALCHHAKLFQGFMILRDSPDSLSNLVTSDRERRTARRYTFVATTEITGSGNAGTLSGRVTEISREGCYVDILNALPAGTLLNVRIICDKGIFVTKGKIVYVDERIGMGVAFLDPLKDQLKILDSWLAELPPVKPFAVAKARESMDQRQEMICEVKEKMENRLAALNDKLNVLRSDPDTPNKERMELMRERVSLNDEIREHLRVGHNGKRCPSRKSF
jgi:hypothetical protein